MIRDIPPFELGYTTNGAGDPVEDSVVAYSDHAGIERQLSLDGEGAINLMPIIVQALNSYDEMMAALRMVRSSYAWEHLAAKQRQMVEAALTKAEGRDPA